MNRSISERDRAGRREFLEFARSEAQEKLDAEDAAEYAKYCSSIAEGNERAVPAEQVQALPFEQWRNFMAADEPNPVIRAAIATNKALWQANTMLTRERVASLPLLDEELELLGFDLTQRLWPEVNVNIQMGMGVAAHFFRTFIDQEPRFDKDAHLEPLTEFLERNRLYAYLDNIGRAFSLLLAMGLVEPKREAQPIAEGLNEHRVKLAIEHNPEAERQRRRQAYYTMPVATDEATGDVFSQYQLDKMPAEQFRKLMFGLRQPRISDVMRAPTEARCPKHGMQTVQSLIEQAESLSAKLGCGCSSEVIRQ